MKRTRLDNWICETESLPELTREGLEALLLLKDKNSEVMK